MKTIIVALLLSLCSAFADTTNLLTVYYPTPLLYTNGVPDNVTYDTNSITLDCRRDRYIAWNVSFNLSGSGTAVNYFDFERSIDNTNWTGAFFYTLPLAANGTSTVSTNFVMDTEQFGYVRLNRVRAGNNSGSYTTNLSLIYTPKPYVR